MLPRDFNNARGVDAYSGTGATHANISHRLIGVSRFQARRSTCSSWYLQYKAGFSACTILRPDLCRSLLGPLCRSKPCSATLDSVERYMHVVRHRRFKKKKKIQTGLASLRRRESSALRREVLGDRWCHGHISIQHHLPGSSPLHDI